MNNAPNIFSGNLYLYRRGCCIKTIYLYAVYLYAFHNLRHVYRVVQEEGILSLDMKYHFMEGIFCLVSLYETSI